MTAPWEYKVVKFPVLYKKGEYWDDEEALNFIGVSGWELVSIDMQTGTAFFKRPKTSNEFNLGGLR